MEVPSEFSAVYESLCRFDPNVRGAIEDSFPIAFDEIMDVIGEYLADAGLDGDEGLNDHGVQIERFEDWLVEMRIARQEGGEG